MIGRSWYYFLREGAGLCLGGVGSLGDHSSSRRHLELCEMWHSCRTVCKGKGIVCERGGGGTL